MPIGLCERSIPPPALWKMAHNIYFRNFTPQTRMDGEEIEENNRIIVQTTATALLKAPDPVAYLNILLDFRLVDTATARAAAVEYIATVNRFQTLIQMSFYDIEPFKSMDLEGLKGFIAFTQRHRLDAFRDRRPFSSTL